LPLGVGIVVFSSLDGGVEQGVRRRADPVERVTEVLLELRPQFEVGPPVARGERERVQMARGVDACARVAVIQPVAARRVVIVDDQVVHTHPLQTLGCDDPGHPGTYDENPEAGRDIGWRLLAAHAIDPARELVGDHHAVALIDRLADADGEHRPCLLRRRRGEGRRLAALQVMKGLGGSTSDFGLDIVGQTTRVVVAEAFRPGRQVRSLQPAGVTSHLVDHHQQRRNVR